MKREETKKLIEKYRNSPNTLYPPYNDEMLSKLSKIYTFVDYLEEEINKFELYDNYYKTEEDLLDAYVEELKRRDVAWG